MKICIAGSRRLPTAQAGRLLISFLAGLPLDTVLLLRHGISTPAGHFEWQVAQLAKLFDYKVEWRRPKPGGREETHARDVEMVCDADLTLCFVHGDQIGDDTSGTWNLSEKAVQYDRIVYTYALERGRQPRGDWSVIRVGEHDPGGEWADRVPAA